MLRAPRLPVGVATGGIKMPLEKSTYSRQRNAYRNSFPLAALVAIPFALLLCGCLASAPETSSNATTPVQTTVSQAAAPPDSIPNAAHSRDKTADFKMAKKNAPWWGYIKSVTEIEPGRISVETSLMRPRDTEGSEEVKSAIDICQSVVALFGPRHVSVSEDDGTNFVLFGHPSVSGRSCAEV